MKNKMKIHKKINNIQMNQNLFNKIKMIKMIKMKMKRNKKIVLQKILIL